MSQQRDRGSGLGEGERDRPTDAAAGPADQRRLSGQRIEHALRRS